MNGISLYSVLKVAKGLVEAKMAEKPKGGIVVNVFGKKQKYTYKDILENIEVYMQKPVPGRVAALSESKEENGWGTVSNGDEYKHLGYKGCYKECMERELTDSEGKLRKTKNIQYYIDLLQNDDIPF